MAKVLATKVKKTKTPENTSKVRGSNGSKKTISKNKLAEAHIRYIHIAPFKVQQLVNLVRGKKLSEAENILINVPRRAVTPVLKAIKSAEANARNNYDLDPKYLFIKTINVGQSMSLPRMRPRAQGRAFGIRKRFTHINVVLEEKAPAKSKKKLDLKNNQPKNTVKDVKKEKRFSVIKKTKIK